MVLGRWQASIVDDDGSVQPAASIEVRREVSGAPLASLFSDRDGAVPIGNPFFADSEGFAAFHVVGGSYRITATKGSFSRTWRYVDVGTTQGLDIEGITIPVGETIIGQVAEFADETGNTIRGADAGGSPSVPIMSSDLVLGPDGAMVAGQLAIYVNADGRKLDGALDGMDPLTVTSLLAMIGGGGGGGMPRGYISGVVISNNSTDATNDIDIATGAARDDGNTADMVLASAITKRLDASWAVGTGNGGLDTGSIANTTYHVWLIKRSDTDVVDVLFSTSATSPTMPANYDLKRRIGSIIRTGGAIVPFRTMEIAGGGVEFLRNVPINNLDEATQSSSGTLRTLSIPTGVQFHGIISGYVADDNGNPRLLITSPDQADTAAAGSLFTSAALADDFGSFQLNVRTNTSAQIRTRIVSTGDAVISLITHGWIDHRIVV